MTHCHREFLHAQWEILLDDEFIEAWKHGIVIACCNGITRQFYPRIFIYSADYPEKCKLIPSLSIVFAQYHSRVLLASIRNKGACPCPCCLIPLSHVHNIGMVRDMMQRVTLARALDDRPQNVIYTARKLIYEKGYSVESTLVNDLLKDKSLLLVKVPIHSILSSTVMMTSHFRMLSLTDWDLLVSIPFRCFSQMSCTKLRVGLGGPCLFT